MRVILLRGDVLEINWMWLPTFISQNRAVMRQLQKEGLKEFKGMHATNDELDRIHKWTLDWICKKFPIDGLMNYLEAIEKVPMEGNDVSVHTKSS